jgi:hypothetical protein
MDLIFFNCRLYNGVESPVGQMGARVHAEYTQLLKTFNLLERFDNLVECTKFTLDEQFDSRRNNLAGDAIDAVSESELPLDSIKLMNDKQYVEG